MDPKKLPSVIKIGLCGVVCAVFLLIWKPWLFVVLGAVLGVIAGVLWKAMLQEQNVQTTALYTEQNQAVFASKRRTAYLIFYWGSNVGFLLLSLILHQNILVSCFAAVAAFEVAKESVLLAGAKRT